MTLLPETQCKNEADPQQELKIASLGEAKMLSSEQEGAEPRFLATSLSTNNADKDKGHDRRVYRSHVQKLRKNSSLGHNLAPARDDDANRDGEQEPTRPVHLGGSFLVQRSNFRVNQETERGQLRVGLTHSCQNLHQAKPCVISDSKKRSGTPDQSHATVVFLNRWTKRRQKEKSNTSDGISERFLDCEFNVNTRFNSEQSLAKIKPSVDDW